MDQDQQFISQFKSGDLGGFEMLVKKYQKTAVDIAYSLTFNLVNAEDIAQEAFIKVYHNLDSFRGESKFSSWFYRIIVNTAYDFLRRSRQALSVSLDDASCPQLSDNNRFEDPLVKETVEAALKKLPFKYRSVIILKEIEGYSYQEIAGLLRISIGTVESRIFRARKMLKDILVRKGVVKYEV
jgi:RNA polymerase sigma-70 factor (ECF subfamily)